MTEVFKGGRPGKQWLHVNPGCHSEPPFLLEKGVFAVLENGTVSAGYEHQTEFFDYEAALHILRSIRGRTR